MIDAKVQIQNTTSDTYLSVVLQVSEDLDNVYLKYTIALDLGELYNTNQSFSEFL